MAAAIINNVTNDPPPYEIPEGEDSNDIKAEEKQERYQDSSAYCWSLTSSHSFSSRQFSFSMLPWEGV